MKNKVQLIGYLGQDPELRSFENDVVRMKGSIATHDRVKTTEGTYDDRTTWHNVVLFNKVAIRASKILKKGDLVAFEGPLSYHTYTNAEEQPITRAEVIVRDFAYLGSTSAKSRSEEVAVA
jgi:single-strand DNA-binding protein